MTEQTRRRASHLMDLDAPRPVRDHAAEQQSLSNVQKWVMSTLAVSTLLHLSIGLLLAATYVPELSGRIVLCVVASAFGVLSVAVGMAIHGRKPLSPWLLLGVLPGLVGAWFFLT